MLWSKQIEEQAKAEAERERAERTLRDKLGVLVPEKGDLKKSWAAPLVLLSTLLAGPGDTFSFVALWVLVLMYWHLDLIARKQQRQAESLMDDYRRTMFAQHDAMMAARIVAVMPDAAERAGARELN